jgi:hypothetical protein
MTLRSSQARRDWTRTPEELLMGLMPAGATNPFTPVDQQTIFGMFKSSASHDPDVLYAQKETMLAPYKNLKRLAILSAVVGALFTVTVVVAILGIPLMIGAWWVWRFQAKNSAAVEAGYAQYLASVRPLS